MKIDYSDISKDNERRVQKLDEQQTKTYRNMFDYIMKEEPIDQVPIYLSVVLSELESGKVALKDERKYFQKISSKARYKEEQIKIRNRDYEKFSVAGIWEVFTVFVVLLFFKSWLLEDYLIGYSFDILIAILASYIAVRSVRVKQKLIRKYHFDKKYILLDIVTIILCFIIKMLVTSNFDITFLLLVGSYFIIHKQIKKLFAEVV